MKLIFVLVLIFASSELLACSCGTVAKIDKEAITEAKDIFVGKVVKVEFINNQSRKVTYQLVERLKTDSNTQITIMTGLGGADCGLNVNVGQEWYVFTYDDNGFSWAGLCGRSALLSEHSINFDPQSKSYYRKAVKGYNKQRKRAVREISFIKRQTAANIKFGKKTS